MIFKRQFFSFSHVIAGSALTLAAISAQADHVKLFLLGGQSNMTGTGTASELPTAPVNLQQPQDDVLFYYDLVNQAENSGLTTLRPGSGTSGSQFGPEVTFGRAIADARPSDSFGLIKHAANGSEVSRWHPDTGDVYAAFRDTVAEGLTALTTAGHTYEITGMLWTQGERDARVGVSTAAYEAGLNGFIADIRTRYGTDLPFFLSRLSSGHTDVGAAGLARIRTAQENVAAADVNAYLINTDGMSILGDNLHFDSAGHMALGQAFAQSYLTNVPEPSSLALLGLGGLLLASRRRRG